MNAKRTGPGRYVAGVGGALLIVSLFLPWTDGLRADVTGWELWGMADVFLLLVGLAAIWVMVTGGRFGLFRPDLSLEGAADLLSVTSALILTWVIFFDFPQDADPGAGAYLALAAAVTVACAVGDYRIFRGAPMFPVIHD